MQAMNATVTFKPHPVGVALGVVLINRQFLCGLCDTLEGQPSTYDIQNVKSARGHSNETKQDFGLTGFPMASKDLF